MGTEATLTALAVKTALAAGLAAAATFTARRFQQGRPAPSRRRPLLRVLETVSVGQQRTLHLVAVGDPESGGRVVLIGSTSHQITFLAPAELPPEAVRERPAGARFGELLRGLVSSSPPPAPSLPAALHGAARRLRGATAQGAVR